MKTEKRSGVQNGRVPFEIDEGIHWYPDDKQIILRQFKGMTENLHKNAKRADHKVYNYEMGCSFDIETSSIKIRTSDETKQEQEDGGKKFAFMYIWQFSVNGRVILGRTWEQFLQLMDEVAEAAHTDKNHRLIVYDENFGYEFGFLRKLFQWHEVFSVKKRRPLYACTESGIEFRDAYLLTGKSLAKIGEDLTMYKMEKMVGDLDYTKVRGCITPLSDKELGYCIHDCLVIDCLIEEKRASEYNGIASIPLTNTGYVRRFMREICLPSGRKNEAERNKYLELMKKLQINDAAEYDELKRAFAGGFTHANALYVNKKLTGRMDSFDFTSSYPAVILSEMFPMSKGTRVVCNSFDEFKEYCRTKCCVFDVKFTNLREKAGIYENPLSYSKCTFIKNETVNNGRVVKASEISTTITNVDFSVFQNFYDWDSFEVSNMIIYDRGYLPESIIRGVLELYKAKTELKGIEDQAAEYQLKKGMLNSVYGCMVTDIIQALVEYSNSDGWDVEPEYVDKEEKIEIYNKSKKRFLFYPWGVFVTSYARRNLFTGILEFGEDYIYSDTDSIKCRNADKHMEYIKWYNVQITRKIDKVLTKYKIDTKESRPKTIKGVEKQIGVWDWETEGCPYTEFKTCGAKRYMYTQKGKIHTTIAGLPKKKGAEYISAQKDPYEFFSNEMTIPSDSTGKLMLTYIDKPIDGIYVDYLGNKFTFHEESAIHMEGTPFSMSEVESFLEYLDGVQSDMDIRGDMSCVNITAQRQLIKSMLYTM